MKKTEEKTKKTEKKKKDFKEKSLFVSITSIFVFLVLFGVVGGASVTSTEPIVTVSGYTISPVVVKPGISGSVSVTFKNTGDATATDLTIAYGELEGSAWSGGTKSAGDLAVGTDITLVIPFHVPETYKSGVYSLPLLIFYNSKSANFVIPISVSNPPNIVVVTQNLSKNIVKPGEDLEVSLLIDNLGGDAKDLIITTPQNSTFQLSGISKYHVPLLPGNSSINITLGMASSSSISTGKYNAPLNITYTDLLGNSVSELVTIGQINVNDPETLFTVTANPISDVEVGGIFELNLTLFNHGYKDEKRVFIEAGASNFLVPIGSPVTYFDVVPAGGQSNQILQIGVNPSTTPGYYSIPLKIKLGDGQSFNTSIGIQIQTASMINIVSETNPSFLTPGATADLTLKISNTGDSGIRSTSLSLSSDDLVIVGQKETFIGTLNIDETTDFITQIRVPPVTSTGIKSLRASISFKDSSNVEHKLDKIINLRIITPEEARNYTNVSQSSRFRTRTNGGTTRGLELWQYGVIAAVALVVLYFAYKWWTGKRKK